MLEQTFKVGNTVRLTITDKNAEEGQWFETTVMGVSSKSGVLLNMAGVVLFFDVGNGEGNGVPRTIDLSALFYKNIQRFCFYSVLDWEDGEHGEHRQWDEFNASLELV